MFSVAELWECFDLVLMLNRFYFPNVANYDIFDLVMLNRFTLPSFGLAIASGLDLLMSNCFTNFANNDVFDLVMSNCFTLGITIAFVILIW